MCHQRHWVWIYWAINDTRVCLIEEINQLMKQGISGLRVKTCADPQTELRSSGWTKSEYFIRLLLHPCYTPETLLQTPASSLIALAYARYSVGVKELSFKTSGLINWAQWLSISRNQERLWAIQMGRIWWPSFQLWKLAWFPNHNLTDLREAKGNNLLRHMDTQIPF